MDIRIGQHQCAGHRDQVMPMSHIPPRQDRNSRTSRSPLTGPHPVGPLLTITNGIPVTEASRETCPIICPAQGPDPVHSCNCLRRESTLSPRQARERSGRPFPKTSPHDTHRCLFTADGRMVPVAKTRRDAAPNAEWALMYRAGLTRGRIAELVRAPASTVGYHLRVAAAADPGLRQEHEAAAARKTMVTAPGLERMQQLVALVQETGRYPSTNAESTGGSVPAALAGHPHGVLCRGERS